MLALLIACVDPPDRSATLPRLAAAAVVMQDGSTASIAVELDKPHSPPTLRYAAGLVLFDGQHLAEPKQGAFVDQLDGEPVRARVGVAHIDGPGEGFTLSVHHGRLLLELPHMGAPIPLLEGVDHAVALYLLTPSEVDPIAKERLDARFKAVGGLRPASGAAVVDGALDEWRHQRALAIDEPAYVLDGEAWWDGPRDAAMALAARVDGETLRLAVRLRDDDLRPRDEIVVKVGWTGTPLRVPLTGEGCALPACARSEVTHGVALELALQAPASTPLGALPLVVSFHDQDGQDPATILANAPSLDALAMSLLDDRRWGEGG